MQVGRGAPPDPNIRPVRQRMQPLDCHRRHQRRARWPEAIAAPASGRDEGVADPKAREPGEVPIGREQLAYAVVDADSRDPGVVQSTARCSSVDD